MHHGRPYRADQVGSHLRPDALIAARQRAAKGEITHRELRAIEDRCIREIVAMQEQMGLPCVTDGEFRRGSWNKDFLAGFDNVVERPGNLKVFHRNPDGSPVAQVSAWGVTGKIKRSHQIQVEDFKFLKSIAQATPKTCLPSPTLLHFRGGRQAIDQTAYPDIEQFFDDAAAAYRHDERAGGFEALKDVPSGKFIVLGLITTKRPDLESKDALKRRIDAAAKIVPLDRLCLSPQCGFASAVAMHARTKLDDEKAKLQLLVQTATEVWGEA